MIDEKIYKAIAESNDPYELGRLDGYSMGLQEAQSLCFDLKINEALSDHVNKMDKYGLLGNLNDDQKAQLRGTGKEEKEGFMNA